MSAILEGKKTISFDEIYQEYASRILNLAFRMTGAEETARDLTQDIFIKVYQNLKNFREQSGIYTWIYRIALNHIYNYLKQKQRQRWLNILDVSVNELLNENKIDDVIWPDAKPPLPDSRMEKQQREQLLWKLIQQLPPKQRVPFILQRYENMSYEEIANLTDLSKSAVESRIHRAKISLAKKLEKWLDKI